MRFPTVFRRRVGPAPEGAPSLPELGSDKVPVGEPSQLPKDRRGAFHTSRLVNMNGFPAQRVAVGCVGPAGVSASMPTELYLWEDSLRAWLLIGRENVSVDGLTFFDAPCLLDAGRARSEDESHNPGTLDVFVRVTLQGREDVPPGEYAFCVATDVSNPGRG